MCERPKRGTENHPINLDDIDEEDPKVVLEKARNKQLLDEAKFTNDP